MLDPPPDLFAYSGPSGLGDPSPEDEPGNRKVDFERLPAGCPCDGCNEFSACASPGYECRELKRWVSGK